MTLVLDYSSARPAPAAIKTVAIGVMRYLSTYPPKNLSPGERDALFAEGLEIGLVWETTAQMMNGGLGQGRADAVEANRQADALGFPGDRPLYFANDQNACTQAHMDYMRGARDASGRPVGPYGNTDIVNRCHDELGCQWGWKVSTWQGPTPNACLVQEANMAPPLAGTDANSVWRDDWGQWHGGSVTPPKPVFAFEDALLT